MLIAILELFKGDPILQLHLGHIAARLGKETYHSQKHLKSLLDNMSKHRMLRKVSNHSYRLGPAAYDPPPSKDRGGEQLKLF